MEVNFYVVNTNFIPDVERNGQAFDYAADELLNSPDNMLLEIKRRQHEDSADGPIRSSTTNGLPSSGAKVAQIGSNVKTQFSLSKKDFSIAPPVGADVHGKDIGYDIAPPIPESVRRSSDTGRGPLDVNDPN